MLTAPEHGATVPQQPLTLQFTDAGRMWLDVGTTPRGDELLSTAITGTQHVLNNLPSSGTLYITLWTYLNDAWQFSEYSVLIAGDTQPETSDPETDSEQPSFTSTPGQVTYHALDYSGAEGVQLYAGRDSGEGVDLVVLAEGYTQAQLSQFVRDAEQLIDTAFDFHPLNKHLPAWNIHLLSLASNESGADHAVAQGDLVDTRFGANYWCGNTERLLCINASSVKTAVAQYVPQYDEILVLVNSSKYGGAGYSSGIATASLASAVVNLIRHEVAHSFAGLADEYSYGRSTAPSSEPRGANATLETNPANLKWRHWIDDVNSVVLNEGDDVGLFEGAVYVSQGAYRPTRNSLMRSLGQPFFEVNSEAWSLAVYKHIKPILSTVPEVGAVSMQLGDAQWFALESLYGAQEVSVQWSLNGQPISPDAENPFALQFTATDSGNYFLTATVTDNTGVIRRDLTTTARQTLQWSLNIQ